MRDTDKRNKNSQRGRRIAGKYNRPHSIWRDGRNFELHPALYGETPVLVDPDSDLKSLLRNDPKSPDWIPDGLTWGEELYRCREDPRFGRLRDYRYGGNDEYRLSRPPRANGRRTHGRGQQLFPWQTYNDDQCRPSHRGRRTTDVRDPRNSLPPLIRENYIFLGDGKCEIPGDRGGQPRLVYGVPIAGDLPPYSRGGRYSNLGGGRMAQGPSRHRGRKFVRMPPRRHPGIYNDWDEDEPAFIPRLPYGREEEEEEDDEEGEETRSQRSTESYVRLPLSPRILYASLPPPHGHSLGRGRHENDTDDEDGEQFRLRRGGFLGRRKVPYGIGRDGGRFRIGRRSFEDEGLFSGDQDDEYRS